ncbi:MAG: transcriptional repressor [Spirochaetaceae bacterium]|jgi:Fur family ferric uptake transcriptional regulator|nr:transcriptional repressor [Spirochaetaceae bacterium]
MEHKRPKKYQTRQGDSVLAYMQSMGDCHVTIVEAMRHFDDLKIGISQTTVYRHLEKLTLEGKLRKYILSDGKSACYQYINDRGQCREHLHLKCEICGTLIHAEGDLLGEIDRQLLAAHSFQINALKTVFYGICKECLSDL